MKSYINDSENRQECTGLVELHYISTMPWPYTRLELSSLGLGEDGIRGVSEPPNHLDVQVPTE